MIEITNRTKGPTSVMVRSRTKVRSFTFLTIPGKGKGYNVRIIEDEAKTEHVDRLEHWGFISTRNI